MKWTSKADLMIHLDNSFSIGRNAGLSLSRLQPTNYATVWGAEFRLLIKQNGGYFKYFTPAYTDFLKSIKKCLKPDKIEEIKPNKTTYSVQKRIYDIINGIPRYSKKYFTITDSSRWELRRDTLITYTYRTDTIKKLNRIKSDTLI